MPVESIIQEPGGFSYGHITFLTFQAVIEVVIVCVSGFWAATAGGLLNNDATKIISRLNVDLFTPALIFTKLASSLSLKKLLEVIIIPILYAVTTLVSLCSSWWVSKQLGLTEPEGNFVTAMAVFGNSNSLPVSLTLALAYTLPGLKWDDVPDDDADKIASRGLIYLLIFQQLGQMLRWSWGYNKLLKRQPAAVIYHKVDEEMGLSEPVIPSPSPSPEPPSPLRSAQSPVRAPTSPLARAMGSPSHTYTNGLLAQRSVNRSVPLDRSTDGSISESIDSEIDQYSPDVDSQMTRSSTLGVMPVRTVSRNPRGQIVIQIEDKDSDDDDDNLTATETTTETVELVRPSNPFKQFLTTASAKIIGWMNPPLWSMLLAIFVASIEPIRYQFYEANGFIQSTLAAAIRQLGSVSIPLILVVLGANLAPSSDIPPACPHYGRIVFGSLFSRMVLPSLVLLPLITLSVKYINLSIMDDPIFLITSFLLITSPPAIQLSQICQLNEIYQKEMAGVLFYGYAILTLPVTIIVVVAALKALQWAQAD